MFKRIYKKIFSIIFKSEIDQYKDKINDLQKEVYNRLIVYCNNPKCLDWENGKCSLGMITIKQDGRCDEFGEDDIDMMAEFRKEITSPFIIVDKD